MARRPYSQLKGPTKMNELQISLLTQAFDGRPLMVQADGERWCIRLDHEAGQYHSELKITLDDLNLLERDIERFTDRIAKPVMANLDLAVYPERMERWMAASRRTSEILLEGHS